MNLCRVFSSEKIHRLPRLLSFLLFSGLFFSLSGCAGKTDHITGLEQATPCITTGWPQDVSDLSADPALVFGTLENGLRYVIMKNNEPRNRVGLYLNIQAGSLHETDEQRGLAHYLEHMLFNGTTHYPPGTLIEYFQSIGMGFGADSNAHTSFDETVFTLLLPSGEEDVFAKGLLVLADYARGALLLAEEVDRERGIILAEKRARDSAAARVSKERMKFDFAGTRVAVRDPIGIEEVLESADAPLLRSYYDAWYRPENMIVVVVGDVDPAFAETMIVKQLAGLKAADKKPDCPDYGKISRQGTDVFYMYEPDLGYTEISVQTVWNEAPRPDTRQWEEKHLKNYVAASMLDNRLKRLVSKPDSPLTKTRTYSGVFLQRIGYSSLIARADATDWDQALALLRTTLRQALTYGFDAAELSRVKKEILSHLEQQVQTADSRDSRKLATTIIGKLNDNGVILSPEQELRLYKPLLETMTIDEVNRAFRELWQHDNRLLGVTGTADLKKQDETPETLVIRVWNRSAATEIKPWEQESVATFPYLPLPAKPGAVLSRQSLQDIDAQSLQLTGGVQLNLKNTDFQENEVMVAVHFGEGQLSEPQPGLGMVAEAVIRESGLGALTREQLREALAGRNGEVEFKVDSESFVLKGKGLSSELELIFQLVYASLHDPAFRPEAYRLSMERFTQMYDMLEKQVEGAVQLSGTSFFAGANPRYGLPAREQLMSATLEQVGEWLQPILKKAPLEITVVGDIDELQVVSLATRYFGGSERTLTREFRGTAIDFPSGEKLQLRVASNIDKAVVMVAWPTDDFWDISRTRRLGVLASVLDDRLRREIREELGATYSPVVYNRSSRIDPGYGVLQSMIIADPRQVEVLAEKLTDVGGRLAREGVGQEELQRALEPALTSIRDMMRTNRYWLESVLSLSSRHPQQLQWPLSIRKDFSSITAEDISEFAARYLQPDKSAGFFVYPADK